MKNINIETLQDREILCKECGNSTTFTARIEATDLIGFSTEGAEQAIQLRNAMLSIIDKFKKANKFEEAAQWTEDYNLFERMLIEFTNKSTQEAYEHLGFEHDPVYCADCREMKKAKRKTRVRSNTVIESL